MTYWVQPVSWVGKQTASNLRYINQIGWPMKLLVKWYKFKIISFFFYFQDDELVQKDRPSLAKKLTEPGYLVFVEMDTFNAFLKDNPIEGLEVKFTHRVIRSPGSFIFPRGSPFTKVMNKGIY